MDCSLSENKPLLFRFDNKNDRNFVVIDIYRLSIIRVASLLNNDDE